MKRGGGKVKLSVGIITFNEERIIAKTLESVKDVADEIVIVDSYSTDKTAEIAKKYGAKVFFEEWKGFGPQKNSVIEKCNGEWILLIDADEVLSSELVDRLSEVLRRESDAVYLLNRCSVCFGKEIKYGGWSNDYVIRLFKKGTAYLDDAIIHEDFITESPKIKLSEKLFHYTYLTFEDYFEKFNKYTSMGALKRYDSGKKASVVSIIFNPIFKFLKMYFLKKGFCDGLHGFILSNFAYFYNFVIQLKLYALQKEGKK